MGPKRSSLSIRQAQRALGFEAAPPHAFCFFAPLPWPPASLDRIVDPRMGRKDA